jgi:hypothetical protein
MQKQNIFFNEIFFFEFFVFEILEETWYFKYRIYISQCKSTPDIMQNCWEKHARSPKIFLKCYLENMNFVILLYYY